MLSRFANPIREHLREENPGLLGIGVVLAVVGVGGYVAYRAMHTDPPPASLYGYRYTIDDLWSHDKIETLGLYARFKWDVYLDDKFIEQGSNQNRKIAEQEALDAITRSATAGT